MSDSKKNILIRAELKSINSKLTLRGIEIELAVGDTTSGALHRIRLLNPIALEYPPYAIGTDELQKYFSVQQVELSVSHARNALDFWSPDIGFLHGVKAAEMAHERCAFD
jgi:hypothetical protein